MVTWYPPRRHAGAARPHALHGDVRRTAVPAADRVGAAARRPVLLGAHLRPPEEPTPDPPDPPPRTTGAGHPPPALEAVATIGTPALWVAAMAQAPAGSTRGILLALGWVGLASLFGRRPRRRGTAR